MISDSEGAAEVIEMDSGRATQKKGVGIPKEKGW